MIYHHRGLFCSCTAQPSNIILILIFRFQRNHILLRYSIYIVNQADCKTKFSINENNRLSNTFRIAILLYERKASTQQGIRLVQDQKSIKTELSNSVKIKTNHTRIESSQHYVNTIYIRIYYDYSQQQQQQVDADFTDDFHFNYCASLILRGTTSTDNNDFFSINNSINNTMSDVTSFVFNNTRISSTSRRIRQRNKNKNNSNKKRRYYETIRTGKGHNCRITC